MLTVILFAAAIGIILGSSCRILVLGPAILLSLQRYPCCWFCKQRKLHYDHLRSAGCLGHAANWLCPWRDSRRVPSYANQCATQHH